MNDSENDARELVRLVGGMPSFVNLIPFNAWPGALYEPSNNKTIQVNNIIYYFTLYSNYYIGFIY